MIADYLNEPKHWVDAGAFFSAVGAIFSFLPQITALLGLVWFAYRIANEILERKIKKQEYELNARKLREGGIE